ncbi:hypothetical protein L1887_00207 [Cichorium endivia]|nr:hypothetical protein L1887_00207 [Cichorium endivia]
MALDGSENASAQHAVAAIVIMSEVAFQEWLNAEDLSRFPKSRLEPKSGVTAVKILLPIVGPDDSCHSSCLEI